MTELNLPGSAEELSERLKLLHSERALYPPAHPRLSLRAQDRADVLKKTAGRCHLCGGLIEQQKFAADHVLAHAAGGSRELDNYLAAHSLCNGCRWFYSAEEFQWILRMGVWARKQMEDQTSIGRKMLPVFYAHEKSVRTRRSAKHQLRNAHEEIGS